MAWMMPPENHRNDHHMFPEESFDSSEENTKSKGRRRKKLLFKTVCDQLEFYFSDANLSKDRFLRQLVEDDPYVPLETFLKFNKINRLVSSVEDIAKAIKKSEILELSEDSLKVHRKTPVRIKDNEDDCTLYVENLPPEITHDELSKVFSQFGKVVYVSIPKYQNTKLIKGFAFVEFDTPKEATDTLQIFKEKGNCLSSQMLPEKLCSIRTFDHQNQSESHKLHPVKEEESRPKSDEDDNMKQQEGTKVNLIDTIKAEPLDSPVKKRKLEDDNGDETRQSIKKEKKDVPCDEESDMKKSHPSDEKVTKEEKGKQEIKKEVDTEISGNESGQDENSLKKKKKKRKKKKHHKEIEIFAKGMVVLSKKEWKRLRNKYLNMQRVNMRRVKQQILEARYMRRQPYTAAPGSDHSRDEEMRPPPPPVDAPKPRVTFVPGVIACVKFNEPVVDVKAFKAEARTQPGVQYVDIHEGAFEAFLRCSSSADANYLIQTKFWKNMSILSGEAESDYWEKIYKDREAKLGNKVRVAKERGRKKLLRKAEIVKATHLHFDN